MQITPAEILNGSISPPREATLLYNTIKQLVGGHVASDAGEACKDISEAALTHICLYAALRLQIEKLSTTIA
jgi:hypothetical protein